MKSDLRPWAVQGRWLLLLIESHLPWLLPPLPWVTPFWFKAGAGLSRSPGFGVHRQQRAPLLTILQRGDCLRLGAEVAVPNVVGGLQTQLVGGEGPQPEKEETWDCRALPCRGRPRRGRSGAASPRQQ